MTLLFGNGENTMEKKYLIGIDGGTQSTKITIFDFYGNIVCEATRSLKPCVSAQVGYSEHPGDDLWDTFLLVCQDILDKFEGDPNEIAGIGLCTIRSCRAFLKDDGTLARPVMSWFDKRAFGPIEAGNDVAFVTTTTGYFTHRLTGNFCDTISNNTEAQWPIDPFTWDWSDDPQKYIDFNISRDRLLTLQMPGSILGYITEEASLQTGFPKGIPVVATANDKAVEALGSGLLNEEKGLVSLGTYIASMVSGSDYLDGSEIFYSNLACMPKRFLYESSGIWRGMWTVSWIINLLGEEVLHKAEAAGLSPEEYMNREAEKIPAGSEGLLTVPEWLMSSFEPHKKGIIMGFDVRHGAAHIYRSIMEGIAMTMKSKYERMCDTVGIHPDRIILSGGGAKSDLFTQIFADVFGVPVVRNEIRGAAGIGSAICAAVATGVYPDFETAVEKMVKIMDVTEPDKKNHQLYKSINDKVFSKISDVNNDLLLELYGILND